MVLSTAEDLRRSSTHYVEDSQEMDAIILPSPLADLCGSAAGAYVATTLLKRMTCSPMDNVLVTLGRYCCLFLILLP